MVLYNIKKRFKKQRIDTEINVRFIKNISWFKIDSAPFKTQFSC